MPTLSVAESPNSLSSSSCSSSLTSLSLTLSASSLDFCEVNVKTEPVDPTSTIKPEKTKGVCDWLCENSVSVEPCSFCEGNAESCKACSDQKCGEMKRICVTCWLKDRSNKQCSRCGEKIGGEARVCELCEGRNGEESFLCQKCADLQLQREDKRVWCRTCAKFEDEDTMVNNVKKRRRMSTNLGTCGPDTLENLEDEQRPPRSRKQRTLCSQRRAKRHSDSIKAVREESGDEEDDIDFETYEEARGLSARSMNWDKAKARARELSRKAKKNSLRHLSTLTTASPIEMEQLESGGVDFIWHHFGPNKTREPVSDLRHYFVQTKNHKRMWITSGWLEKYYPVLSDTYWAGSGIFKPTVWIPDSKSHYIFIFAVGNGRTTGEFIGYRGSSQMYKWTHPKIKAGFDKTFQEAQCQWYRDTVSHTSPHISKMVTSVLREGRDSNDGFDGLFEGGRQPVPRQLNLNGASTNTTSLCDRSSWGERYQPTGLQVFQPTVDPNLLKLIGTIQETNEQTNRRFEIMQANTNEQMKQLGLQLMQGFTNALQIVKADLGEMVDRKLNERLSGHGMSTSTVSSSSSPETSHL